jgi:general stress protein 26
MEFKVFYVGDVSGLSEQQQKEAEAFVVALPHGVIATNNKESGARLSALSNLLPGQTLGELTFVTDTTSQKVANIRQNPLIELLFTDGNGLVVLSGNAKTYTDPETKKAVWQPWMTEHFPDGVEGNTLCVIKFHPASIRAMII